MERIITEIGSKNHETIEVVKEQRKVIQSLWDDVRKIGRVLGQFTEVLVQIVSPNATST